MGDATDNSQGKLTLYTNHGCPWAHRAHIIVKELGLDYEETIIDLERPRDEWYLRINPRGLVPTLQHTHPVFSSSEPETVIESALVVHYLIDAFPYLSGHIYPVAKDPKSAYHRYTLNLLLDTWMNKVNSSLMRAQVMAGTDEVPTAADDPFEAIKTHIEPQLAKVTGHGKGPFFGGAERLTLFEILVAPFVLRAHEFSNDKILAKSFAERLDTLPAYSKWAAAVLAQKSVTYIWDRDTMTERTLRRAPEMRKKFGISK
ncbi:hypothetical protein LTR64_004593 [Lithohypha guttulata]|uniref:uncharacterized protein n=1 Tax=Lithohypha guttulata TaxID=1690604 RepID=UPI002DDFFFB0|nr:hypothetical protein LTR51_006109 [Lithohypha guttulata]